jgi:DNA-binding GntR family transcriptional regulator
MADTARALADIARELSRLSSALAACAKGNPADVEVLTSSQEALDRISRQLDDWTTSSTSGQEKLRQEILDTLRRDGPALFPELAAATLSLPDEIRPVLQAMEREGLVEIRTMRGWQLVSLTDRGRREAGSVPRCHVGRET